MLIVIKVFILIWCLVKDVYVFCKNGWVEIVIMMVVRINCV